MTAPYDAHADWYEDYTGTATPYLDRVRVMLADLLGPGDGRPCLDLCCGTGAHAAALRASGWRPLGVDVSRGQLRHARPRLPAVAGDAAALPVRDAALPAVACLLAHTDVPDYAATLREAARVLAPGGRYVHVGLHPCFVGPHCDRRDPERWIVVGRYFDRRRTYESWSPGGVRVRVGGTQVTMADLVNGVVAAGLRIERMAEDGDNGMADLLGLVAVRP
jgi:SAM-dependent methyltransferase